MGQTRLLATTFFGRLFESDLMPQGLPQVQLVVWSLVFAGAPTLGLPMLVAKKYTRLYITGGLPLAMATDRAILFTLSMLSIGFVGLLIWDGIFPDKRDVRILGPLPIRARTFVVARLIALARVFVLFTAAICIPQAVFFGLLAGGYGDPAGLIRGPAAHFATAAAACVLVFSTLLALQCVLLSVLGRRAAQTASVLLQLAFAVGLIQLLFFLPQLSGVIRARDQMVGWSSAASLFPGVWFLAMYETLGGSGGANAATMAKLTAALTMIAPMLAVLLYAAVYQRLSSVALEGVPLRASPPLRMRRALSGADTPVASLRTAVRQFVLRTLVRTRQHRMILAVCLGVAVALVLSSILSLSLSRRPSPFRPGISLLSIPLVFQFLVLVGIRLVAAIPVEPKANWAFRAAEPIERPHAVDGVRDAMHRAVVVPTTLLALVEGQLLWGFIPALCHALFCWALGRLLVEILLMSLHKIPFTCSYLPGRARLRTMWPFYLMAFTTYCYTMAGLELVLLRTPTRLVAFSAFLFVAGQVAAMVRRRTLVAAPGLRFTEEDPDALFEGFRLSEGLAATRTVR